MFGFYNVISVPIVYIIYQFLSKFFHCLLCAFTRISNAKIYTAIAFNLILLNAKTQTYIMKKKHFVFICRQHKKKLLNSSVAMFIYNSYHS